MPDVLAPADPSEPEGDPVPEPVSPGPRRQRRVAPRRAAVPAVGEREVGDDAAEDAREKVVTVYVRISIKRRLEAATDGAMSFTAMALTAVDATWEQLRGKWAPAVPANSMFSDWRPSRRRLDEEQVAVTLRLTRSNREVLARLVGEAGAPNRSAFVEAALDLHLPPLPGE